LGSDAKSKMLNAKPGVWLNPGTSLSSTKA